MPNTNARTAARLTEAIADVDERLADDKPRGFEPHELPALRSLLIAALDVATDVGRNIDELRALILDRLDATLDTISDEDPERVTTRSAAPSLRAIPGGCSG